MRIVTRAEWGARKPKAPFATVRIAARTATCVHHDGSSPVIVRSFAEACARVRADEAYHMNHNGWAGIGYNYLVVSAPGTPVDGLIFEGRGRDAIGAHCLNWNTPWIGVQVAIGGTQKPSPAALVSVKWLHVGFVAAARHALGQVGHKDGFNTECPGPILYAWVHAGMPVTATPTAPPTPEVDMPLTQADAQLVVHELLVTTLGRSDTNVAQALQTAAGAGVAPASVAAIAAAVVAALPAGGSGVTAAQIAKAVNDDAAKRLLT